MGAHLQACMCTVSSSGQRSSRQRSSAALLMSSAVRAGSASARLRTPDSPSRSVLKSAETSIQHQYGSQKRQQVCSQTTSLSAGLAKRQAVGPSFS